MIFSRGGKRPGALARYLSVLTNQRHHHVPLAGEDLPILLQQAPKSQAQASATILRGLLDPLLAGETLLCSCFRPPPPSKKRDTVTQDQGKYSANYALRIRPIWRITR